jgi:hypothetical protein
VETNWSLSWSASFWACANTSLVARLTPSCVPVRPAAGRARRHDLADPLGVGPEPLEERLHHAVGLLDQGVEQVQRQDLGLFFCWAVSWARITASRALLVSLSKSHLRPSEPAASANASLD